MKLTLLMPGLSWLDVHDGAEVCKNLDLPALATLLGRGTLRASPQSLSALYRQHAGQEMANPAATLAARSAYSADGHWLMADPVHVRIDRDRALLADVGVMRLAQSEADALVAALNQHFAEDGLRFYAPQPGRWLLQLSEPCAASFTPLADAVGENVNEHLPGGARGLYWSRLLNEMQMLLYTHPVNDERELRGDLSVNSVWLWGEPVEPASSLAPVRPDLLLTDDALLQEQAASQGWASEAMPFDFAALLEMTDKTGQVLLVQDGLLAAAQYRDAWGWRDQLQAMERNWFQPILQALQRGQLAQLRLQCHGPAGFELLVTSRDRWKIWRRPQAPAALYLE